MVISFEMIQMSFVIRAGGIDRHMDLVVLQTQEQGLIDVLHKTFNPAEVYRQTWRGRALIHPLNVVWKEEHGGHLRIYLPDGPLDILPVAGRIVCFRSDQLEHEVLPATRARLSLTGWMLDQYADLKHL